MKYLIPKTLSYYFTKSGYPKFKDWYKSIDLLEPIYNELEILTNIIDKSNWLEDELRNESFKNIKNIIINQIKNIEKKEPVNIYKEWINSIQPYCFQGGTGHKIQYGNYDYDNDNDNDNDTLSYPHHWCIKPEFYNIVINIPNNVILSAIICDKYINISEISEKKYWCN